MRIPLIDVPGVSSCVSRNLTKIGILKLYVACVVHVCMALTCPVGETIVRLCSLIGVRVFLRLLVRHGFHAFACAPLFVHLFLCDYMSDLLS